MKTNAKSVDTYQRITDFVMEQLQKGNIIWQKGWNQMGMPRNMITMRYYQGFNAFLLNFVTNHQNYKTPLFLTYNQALAAGGNVKRGEKGFPVTWWATMEDRNKIIPSHHDEIQYQRYRVPKVHIVFNADQTRGLEIPQLEKQLRTHTSKLAAGDEIIDKMPARPAIKHGGDEAWYDRTRDMIMLPQIERFHSDEAYYKTKFHELVHSTGHLSRLNRAELMESIGFGTDLYSKEELTAELGAAFLCGICGMDQEVIINSAGYIQGWLKVLQNDKRLILRASTQAQAAVNYIMNVKEPTYTHPKKSETILTGPADIFNNPDNNI